MRVDGSKIISRLITQYTLVYEHDDFNDKINIKRL